MAVTSTFLPTNLQSGSGGRIAHANTVHGAVNELTAAFVRNAVFNVKDYGALGDSSTNDTAAINAAITAMPTITGGYQAGSGILYFPPGRYMTDGGHVIPTGKKIKIAGAGPSNSLLFRRTGATGDLLTINAQNSGIVDLGIEGNGVNAPSSGEGLVLNAGYGYAINSTINGNKGTGIAIGKAAGAILCRLEGLTLRFNLGYGVYIYATASTDSEWVNVDVGYSGLAGVRIAAGAAQMTNVHTWGNGIEAASSGDKAGIWLNAPYNILTGCESEKNIGAGIQITGGSGGASHADGQSITGGDIWGNARQGIYSFGATKHHAISGVRFRNNGTENTTVSTSSAYANIANESGTEWAITGCTFRDNGLAIGAADYYGYVPTNSYTGRAAIKTVSKHYVELNTAGVPDYCAFSGNVWRTADTAPGAANSYLGVNHQFAANVAGGTVVGPYAPTPFNLNMKAWTSDPAAYNGAGLMTVATHYVEKAFVSGTQTLTNVITMTTAAATTAANAYVALYDSTGNLIAGTQSADVAATWNAAAGAKSFPLGATATITNDFVYISVWINSAATAPTTARSGSGTVVNLGTATGVTSATSPRFGTAANAYTSSGTVAPATLGTVTVASNAWTLGLS